MKAILTRLLFATIILSLYFLLAADFGQSQVISMEEFLRENLASKEVTRVYHHEFTEDIKRYKGGDDFFAVQTESDIKIFNSEGELQSAFTPKSRMMVMDFLENKNMFFARTQNEAGKNVSGIFELDGSPVKIYSSNRILPSPGGKFFYDECSMVGTGPTGVFETHGGMSFVIPTWFECQASAPSDSQFLLLHHKSLSLWDVTTGQELWNSTIPDEKYNTSSAYDMAYSEKNNIIAFHNGKGCYCFDFQGNYLWDLNYYGSRTLIHKIGVSKDDGKVLIYSSGEESNHITLCNRDGSMFLDTTLKPGPGVRFMGGFSTLADVFDDFIVLKYTARFDDKKTGVTAILYPNGDDWASALVDGLWDFYKSTNGEYTISGYTEDTDEVMAYSISW